MPVTVQEKGNVLGQPGCSPRDLQQRWYGRL